AVGTTPTDVHDAHAVVRGPNGCIVHFADCAVNVYRENGAIGGPSYTHSIVDGRSGHPGTHGGVNYSCARVDGRICYDVPARNCVCRKVRVVHLKRSIDDGNADGGLPQGDIPRLGTSNQRVMPLVGEQGIIWGKLPLFERVQLGELYFRTLTKSLN